METRYFTAIIEGDDRPGFSVYFPDLDGCTSAGDTIEAAARNAEEALSAHLALMVEMKESVPEARAPNEIPADPEVTEVARLLVRGVLPSRAVRLNITLDESLVARIDRAAEAAQMTRSGFLAQAAERAIKEGRG